ncbi:hypothetical protein GE061_010247 [Apolygus lucorum]|uniref:Cation/H+ exchanger transmembrane domain-containing protein n=1 Tax=Apolygus lucorum TaxID=248454 RepID=A0A8S9Y2T3_APOLU|nr:hypothetical protein GE061_010247 [Apolygus lucorum]
MPLHVELRGGSASTGGVLPLLPKLSWRDGRKNEYAEKLGALMSEPLDYNAAAQDLVSSMIGRVVRAAEASSMGGMESPGGREPWWDWSCSRARSRSFSLLRLFRESGSSMVRAAYLSANALYKSVCRRREKEYYDELAAQFSRVRDARYDWTFSQDLFRYYLSEFKINEISIIYYGGVTTKKVNPLEGNSAPSLLWFSSVGTKRAKESSEDVQLMPRKGLDSRMTKEGEKAPKECEVLLKGPESEAGAQIVPAVNGSPLKKETVEQRKCGCGGGVVKLISSQGNLGNTWFLTIGSLLVILALTWGVLYVLLLDEAAPGGDLFKLLILIVSAYFAGQLVALCKLPPLLGMLIAGIALRTCGFYKIGGVYLEIVIKLREAALTTILIKAGLGLDAPALLKLSFTVLKLAFVPCLAEAAAAAVVAHVCFDYPYFWGFMLGFMLSAVSPAVVVPTLLSLKAEGYGESKGISTLVIAASGLDDIVAISLFGVFQGMIFTPGSIASQVSVGPIEMVMGLSVGILWGLFIAFVPHRDDAYVTAKRTILLGAGSLGAVLGSEKIHYGGAGPLACITSAFVASFAWKNQGWSNSYHPVADNFSTVWLFIQPVLFGLIGAEIDLLALHSETIAMGFIVVFGALIIRFAACVLCVLGTKLNWKEILFVNLAWLPKATVQAALGPEPLDKVRSSGDPNEADLLRGQQLLTIAVLSILITAPIGSIGISISGPYLLSNEGWEGDKEKVKSIEGADTAMHMSEGSEDVERAKV